MNADRLLALYERVSEAPDAIARLRRFVLDLAVRGKLVEQDPADEPVSKLIEAISNQKNVEAQSSGVSNIPSSDGMDKQEQFEIPATWQWVHAVFPAVGLSDKGKKVKTKEVLSDGLFPVVDQGKVKVRGFCNEAEKVIHVAQPVIIFGDHTRETKFIDFDFVVGADGVKILRPVGIDPRYFHLALTWLPLDSRGYGRHFKLLKSSYIPLPPLAEQHRIVAKVDELMALCDRLEEARKTREETRDKFTAATFARLTAPEAASALETETDDTNAPTGATPNQAGPDNAATSSPSGTASGQPSDFRTHARFAIETLPALTSRPDQIKSLRQTILNLAVRGKLVEQDPADEPAAELLKRIAVERDRLLQTGEIKKQKPIQPIDENEIPYNVPQNWAWARFNEVAAIQSNLVNPKGYPDMPHIAPDNIEGWTARLLPYVTVKRAGVYSGKHLFAAGSILYSKIRPNLAKVTVADFDGLCSADMYPVRPHISRDFMVKFMITEAFVSQSVSEDNRVAMPKINQAALSNILIPVPPLAEQHRIVAKVDALMKVCDRLEAALTSADTTRTRLLEALLHEALEPASETMEAAE